MASTAQIVENLNPRGLTWTPRNCLLARHVCSQTFTYAKTQFSDESRFYHNASNVYWHVQKKHGEYIHLYKCFFHLVEETLNRAPPMCRTNSAAIPAAIDTGNECAVLAG